MATGDANTKDIPSPQLTPMIEIECRICVRGRNTEQVSKVTCKGEELDSCEEMIWFMLLRFYLISAAADNILIIIS